MKASWTSALIFLSFALCSNFLYAEPKIAKAPLAVVVYATRIGTNSWVGKETATGYITKIDDHYVALPYRPLTSKIRDLRQQGRDNPYWVKLEYNGKSTTVPVEELGPWNWYDNYWALENNREGYSHVCHSDFGKTLPQGLPMAQAACINGDDFTDRSCDSTTKFNDGYTDCQERRPEDIDPAVHTLCTCLNGAYEREVRNPAGIDLADGTFYNVLKMTDNDYIKVTLLWIEAATGEETRETGFLPAIFELLLF